MSRNVFTYGSLMFDRVWLRVIGYKHTATEALLCGYKRVQIKNETYPALIPAEAADRVKGLVYLNIDDTGLDKLDRFEGKYYRRRVISCRTLDEQSIRAWVYVFRSQYVHHVLDEPWDPIWFADEGIHQFIAGYDGLQL